MLGRLWCGYSLILITELPACLTLAELIFQVCVLLANLCNFTDSFIVRKYIFIYLHANSTLAGWLDVASTELCLHGYADMCKCLGYGVPLEFTFFVCIKCVIKIIVSLCIYKSFFSKKLDSTFCYVYESFFWQYFSARKCYFSG